MNTLMKKKTIDMRKILFGLLAAVMLVSCGTSAYVSNRTITEMDEVSYILANYYPQLHEYYMEGVLKVRYLKEVITDEGEPAYNIKYSFCRYNYPNFNDRMEALKTYYPEVYQMYMTGVIDITSFYKYVDKESGKIKHHVSFRRIYDFYYGETLVPYHHTRIFYRPRPFPAPRPRPEARPEEHRRPEPNRPRPDARPGNDRPNNPPAARPNNPPRGNQGGGNRPPQGNNGGRRR